MEDELEPIDLEPVDLEPGDRELDGDDSRFDRGRGRRPPWIWVGVAGVGLAAWAAVALTSGTNHPRPASNPPSTSTPGGVAAAAPRVDRITTLASALWTGLRGVGSGRFAAVVDDRLYLMYEARTEGEAVLVPLPEGHVTIDDQSDSSLLATTFQETLVSTASRATRTLSVRDVAIRAVQPDSWWLLRNDGTIRDDHGGASRRVPTGLRVVATVRDGFVALDARSAWVIWSGSTIKPIASAAGQLLAAGPRSIVLKNNCAYNGCSLQIVDLARGTIATSWLPRVFDHAVFSPDGTRLAIASTLGDAYILDTKTGAVVVGLSGLSQNSSLPFSWTRDGRELVVVQAHGIQVLRASDGTVLATIPETEGLEQLFALS